MSCLKLWKHLSLHGGKRAKLASAVDSFYHYNKFLCFSSTTTGHFLKQSDKNVPKAPQSRLRAPFICRCWLDFFGCWILLTRGDVIKCCFFWRRTAKNSKFFAAAVFDSSPSQKSGSCKIQQPTSYIRPKLAALKISRHEVFFNANPVLVLKSLTL